MHRKTTSGLLLPEKRDHPHRVIVASECCFCHRHNPTTKPVGCLVYGDEYRTEAHVSCQERTAMAACCTIGISAHSKKEDVERTQMQPKRQLQSSVRGSLMSPQRQDATFMNLRVVNTHDKISQTSAINIAMAFHSVLLCNSLSKNPISLK